MQIEVRDNFVRIDAISFFGEYQMSPSGRFMVAWETSGRIVLFERSKQILQARVQSPSDGSVANDGRFLIVSRDARESDTRHDVLLCLDSSGNVLLSCQVHAAIVIVGISENGSLAALQTAVSDSDDAMLLMLFDLDSKTTLWRRAWGPEWPKRFDFDERLKKLVLAYPGLGEYEFNADGVFMSTDRWEIDRVKLNHGKTLNQIMEALLTKGIDAVRGNQLLKLLIERSQERWFLENPRDKSYVLRSVGEVQLALGHERQAIEAWNEAVLLNPKVGIQRKLADLKNRLP